MYAWKKFQFFTKEEVKIPPPEGGLDPAALSAPPKQSLQGVTDTCADCGRGCLILGDADGLVHFIRGGFRWQSFRAYEQRVTHVHQLRTKDVVVAVGDDNVAGTVIKILRVNIPQELGEPPAPQPASMIFKTANVTTQQEIVVDSKGDADVTCVRGSDDLRYVAVGLSNGMVLIYRGGSLDQVTKFPPQSSTTPVTGLFFKTVNQSVPTVLFALTADTVATHLLDTPAGGDVSEVLDSNGCQEACCAQNALDNNIFAGRDEGVFIYEYDGGNCSPAGFKGFEGKKKQLISFTRYLLVADVNEQGDDMCTVYDLENQFVAASNPFVGGIRRVFYEWDSVVVLTNDNRVWRLKERNTADKLEKLFSRNLYEVAAELAKSSGYDRHKVSEIYRRFGDHQYEKEEYDSAMTQYLETIGYGVEPSYVIQRFLDVGGAGRIDNLVRYLQRLHEEEEANADHTTLLLNCYTQMGNLDQLDAFIRQEGLNYDVETAITVCRQAGFYEQGLFLAEQHGRHSAWLKLQLDQDKRCTSEAGDASLVHTVAVPGVDRAQDCAAALDYIRALPSFGEAKSAIMDYGRVLLDALPEETTEFLIDLCTGTSHPDKAGTAGGDSNLEEYMDIFLGEGGREQLMVFLERAKSQHEASGVRLERQTTQKVNETLVELYLQTAQETQGESVEECAEFHNKAMALLDDMETSKVDPDHALVLCHQYEFNEGELHLLSERPGMHRQILEKYMAIDDDDRLIEAVKKFAQYDETLWVDVLRHYSQKGNACKAQIQEVLELIEADNALPPLMVVESLSSGALTTLDVCQEYLERQFASDFDVIHEDRKESENYRKDTEAAQKEMDAQLKLSRRTGRRGTTADGAMALTDSPTKYYLREHAQHLDEIGVNPAEFSGRGSVSSARLTPVEFRDKLAQLGPRPGEAGAMPLGSSAGFDLVAELFSQSAFQEGGAA